MDARTPPPIDITNKRREVLKLFNEVIYETIWSPHPFFALQASNERTDLVARITLLTPYQNQTVDIESLRTELDKKAKYWDASNDKKRAVLMVLFDIDIALVEIHKNIDKYNPNKFKDWLDALNEPFIKLNATPKKTYDKLLDSISPIFVAVMTFKDTENKSSISDEKKIAEEVHPALLEVLKPLKKMKNALTKAEFPEDKAAIMPVIKAGEQAIIKLNKLIKKNPLLPSGLPVMTHSPGGGRRFKLHDYSEYFNAVHTWAKTKIAETLAPPRSPSPVESKSFSTAAPTDISPVAAKAPTPRQSAPLSPRNQLTITPLLPPPAPHKKSFWNRHPYLKWGLIGGAVGIIVGLSLLSAGMLTLSWAGVIALGGSLLSITGRKIADSCCQLDNNDDQEEISPRNPHDSQLDHDGENDPLYAKSTTLSPHTRRLMTSPKETKSLSTIQDEIYKFIKALVFPDNKHDQDNLFNFWDNCDNEIAPAKVIIHLDACHHRTFPESIGNLIQLVKQARSTSQKTALATEIMNHRVIQNMAIKDCKITTENLEDVINQQGYKKTLCTILAYRYPDITEKSQVLDLLLKKIKNSSEYDPDFFAKRPEQTVDSAALRASLGARIT